MVQSQNNVSSAFKSPPCVLTIAGSDSGGGAGIQADIKAISANGGYAASVITALTAQNTLGVQGIFSVEPDFIRQQLDSVFSDIEFKAIKIGMLSNVMIIESVAEALIDWKAKLGTIPIVLDPVMVAKGGDRLLADQASNSLVHRLLPIASLITPNLPEAAVMLGSSVPINRDEMLICAKKLLELGAKAVLLKGGHLECADSPDLLMDEQNVVWLEGERIVVKNTHGTGCTLSSALATMLAHGYDLQTAARLAKAYLTKALLSADGLKIGKGIGPVDHFGLVKSNDASLYNFEEIK